jgi:hypothetical protein
VYELTCAVASVSVTPPFGAYPFPPGAAASAPGGIVTLGSRSWTALMLVIEM